MEIVLLSGLFTMGSFSDAVAQQYTVPEAQRSACGQSPGDCSARFSWEDVSEFARPFDFYPGKSVRRAYVNKRFMLGKTRIHRRDVLLVNEFGEINGFWPRKRHLQGNYGFYSKEDYLLHPNGSPTRAVLARNQVDDGKVYPAGISVTLDGSGNILSDDLYPRIEANLRDGIIEAHIPTKLSSNRVIGVAVLPKGSLLYSDDRGYLRRAVVPNSFVYDDAVVRTTEVYLSVTLDGDTQPYVSGFEVTEPMWVGGINIMPADESLPTVRLSIDSAGMVLAAYLATNQIIDGWNLAALSTFQRYHEGGVWFGTLSTDLKYKGSVIPAGASVDVERDGSIAEFSTPVSYKASTGAMFEPGRIGLKGNGKPRFWQPAAN